ncbi:TonB-dependent receptor [Kordiimonas marina]|uniref:TonB-dependent receptor n=1 Tax=Kordiimonas marina TaxID=2872312 RepID=UPI001FF37507|nr:TonB-dependent receptor [Kordiimonas marina]MCJ9428515.1 TonB-dependent receptor [Kordiimonas marina]
MTCAPAALCASPRSATDETATSFDDVIVTAPRLKSADSGQAVTRVDVAAGAPMARLDQLLGAVPGVGLYRRADSLSAHPTTQGLTMRGIGANAAGRVLVTLDGVPLNDPFGGWVYWSAIDPRALGEVTVMKGGSPGAYGAEALAGSLDLRSRPITESAVRAAGSYGNFGSVSASASADVALDDGFFALAGGHFRTDGFYIVPADQRGSADVKAASDMNRVSFRGGMTLSDGSQLEGTVRWFRENRTNGLVLSVNHTDAVDASVRLLHEEEDGAPGYELVAYWRSRSFQNSFAAVDDARNDERLVLDQYHMPAHGAGFLARLKKGALEVGIDARKLSGETNEHFRNLGAGFTRNRHAGGDQWTVGGYMEAKADYDRGSLSATLRLDRWRSYNGVRLETDLASSAVTRSDDVPARAGWQASGRVGADYELSDDLDLRAAAYKSWRLPTINEYYRPFRVGNDITEANPNLVPEKLYGVEAGLDYQPLYNFRLGLTYYRNWLKDGVGNVTVGYGPGFFPLGGYVPAGGVLRQRSNIDESVTDGVEAEADVRLDSGWSFLGRYLYARARITRFAAMPELVGNQPVQTPRHSGSLTVRYDDGHRWQVAAEGRYLGAVYDDDQNTRRIGSVFTLAAFGTLRITESLSLTASAENLLDTRVVSALSATGLETVAMPRSVRVGLRAEL